MRPSRVYNISGIRIEFRIGAYRIGMPTATTFVAMSMASIALGLQTVLGAFALFMLTVGALFYLQWLVHKSDPHHVVSEQTTLRLIVMSLWNRGRTLPHRRTP